MQHAWRPSGAGAPEPLTGLGEGGMPNFGTSQCPLSIFGCSFAGTLVQVQRHAEADAPQHVLLLGSAMQTLHAQVTGMRGDVARLNADFARFREDMTVMIENIPRETRGQNSTDGYASSAGPPGQTQAQTVQASPAGRSRSAALEKLAPSTRSMAVAVVSQDNGSKRSEEVPGAKVLCPPDSTEPGNVAASPGTSRSHAASTARSREPRAVKRGVLSRLMDDSSDDEENSPEVARALDSPHAAKRPRKEKQLTRVSAPPAHATEADQTTLPASPRRRRAVDVLFDDTQEEGTLSTGPAAAVGASHSMASAATASTVAKASMSARDWLNTVVKLMKRGNHEQAIELCTKIISTQSDDKSSTSQQAYFKRAYARSTMVLKLRGEKDLMEANEMAELALRDCDRYQQLTQESSSVNLLKASIFKAMGRWDKVLELTGPIVEENRDSANTHNAKLLAEEARKHGAALPKAAAAAAAAAAATAAEIVKPGNAKQSDSSVSLHPSEDGSVSKLARAYSSGDLTFEDISTQEELEMQRVVALKRQLMRKTTAQLRTMLKHNDQSQSGNKAALVARVADGMVRGCLPRCPTCQVGHLKISKSGGVYCAGSFDFQQKRTKQCDFTARNVDRVDWDEP